MSLSDIVVTRERQADAAAVARLAARAFGPGRFVRSAYRVREGANAGAKPDALKLCAWQGDRLLGSLNFLLIAIGGATGAWLLGPLAIEPDFTGRGCGGRLIEEGLKQAQAAGCRLIVLVGDLAYYGRYGFAVSPPGRITLPGPADPTRILVKELEEGALADYEGAIRSSP